MIELPLSDILLIIGCLIVPLLVVGIGEWISHCDNGKPKKE